MDWVAIVSLTVGCFSIVLAAFAMVISTLNYERTKDVLAEISKQASVIEGTVSETSGQAGGHLNRYRQAQRGDSGGQAAGCPPTIHGEQP